MDETWNALSLHKILNNKQILTSFDNNYNQYDDEHNAISYVVIGLPVQSK